MNDTRDWIVLALFTGCVLIGIWRVARRDIYFAGFAFFFLVYTIFAMVGYRFYPLLSELLNAYFGPELYYTYFWFVAGSFASFFLFFRLLHPLVVGRPVYRVSYEPSQGAVWTTLAGFSLLAVWMAATLARIYSGISYGGTPQIPNFPFAFAFKNSPFAILVLVAFARRHARTILERGTAWGLVGVLGLVFLATALKSANRVDILSLALGLVWLVMGSTMVDSEWRLSIRWDKQLVRRLATLGVVCVVLWFALAAVKDTRGRVNIAYIPTYATVLFNDYYAPAHILFGSMGFHYVNPALVLRSNIANSLMLGGYLDIPYLQTEVGNMLLPGQSSRSTGFAYYIFTEGYMVMGLWGVLYNGIVPVLCLALTRRLGRTTDLSYNALVGAMATMFFPTIARAGNHLAIRAYIFVLVPFLLIFRFLSGARLHREVSEQPADVPAPRPSATSLITSVHASAG